jgi:hypothetical protein
MSYQHNLFDAIVVQGSDLGFAPRITNQFRPTAAQAGSPEKIRVLRWRLEHGLPLWHELDGEAPVFHRERSDDFPDRCTASRGVGRP